MRERFDGEWSCMDCSHTWEEEKDDMADILSEMPEECPECGHPKLSFSGTSYVKRSYPTGDGDRDADDIPTAEKPVYTVDEYEEREERWEDGEG